jgi:vacuolar protein sorting-associated protein 13A/C
MSINIYAPVELENLLPFDIQYQLTDAALEKSFSGRITAGNVSQIYSVELNRTLLLSVDLLETGKKNDLKE